MISPSFVLYCSSCGKQHSIYIDQKPPLVELTDENQQLKEEKLYLNQVCESLSERLVAAESMAAWDDVDGNAIANLL
jgi:hypothetical protein